MDWVGDGVVTLVLGICVTVAVFLPWANVSTGHDVNLSLHAAPGINGALATSWGLPVLALAALVIVAGVVMVATRPVRLSMLPCLAVGLAGLGITLVCFSAGWSIWDPMRPGLGLFVATLGGILLDADRVCLGDGRLRPHLAGDHGAWASQGGRSPRCGEPRRAELGLAQPGRVQAVAPHEERPAARAGRRPRA